MAGFRPIAVSRVDPAVLREMAAVLESIRRDARLRRWTGFAERLDAIDRIEVHVLNRIDNLWDEIGTRPDELQLLHERAQALCADLDSRNRAVLDGLESVIVAGRGRGDDLLQAFERLGCWHPDATSDDRGYDALDSLVHCLLEVAPVPDAMLAREPDMVALQPTPARIVLELARRAEITEADTFYDVGSGLGQVAILMHLLTGATVCGVEIESDYIAYAERCAAALRLQRVTWSQGDARSVSYAAANVLFMYTPFRGQMLADVLAKVEADTRGREIRLATYGPCTQAVSEQSWLKPVRAFVKDGLAIFRRVNEE